jgi:putative membrane protein
MSQSARVPAILATVFVVYFAVLAIDPVSRAVWIAEVIPVVLVFALLVLTYRRFRFSNTAYALMGFWLFWHTLGGHYTFANVPFDWFGELIGSERNHFDRVGHFAVGFYAYPAVEWLMRRGHCRYLAANAFGLLLIMGIAAGYEIVEWWYAVIEGGDAGIEFLGSQGDIWDAQKDMLSDTLGAVFALVLYAIIRPDRDPRLIGGKSAAAPQVLE